jgi:hypothetical protein
MSSIDESERGLKREEQKRKRGKGRRKVSGKH